jgi:hypothetical protein
MSGMAVVYRHPADAIRLRVQPQLASWDRAGQPSQVRLAGFLAHVDAAAALVLAVAGGRIAVELTIGLPDSVSLIDGGRDLDNYLYPVARGLARSGSRPCSAARSTGRHR